jgi:hypothetical protein
MIRRLHILKGQGFVKHLLRSAGQFQISALSGALIVIGSLTSCNLEFRKEKEGSTVQAQVNADFSSIQQNLVNSKCIRCHSGPGSPHGVDLSSYDTIVNSGLFPPLIVPGSPESSSLYTSIAAGRMPKGGPKLSESTVGALYEWIKNGAKEIEDPSTPSPSPTPGGEPPDEPGGNESGNSSGEPGAGATSPGEPSDQVKSSSPGAKTRSVEPCDRRALKNEPGYLKCSS